MNRSTPHRRRDSTWAADGPASEFDGDAGVVGTADGGRGQSEVVGVLLLIGVFVILGSLIGLFILSGVDSTREPGVDVDIEVANATVVLAHDGGDGLSATDVRVVFGEDDGESVGLEDFTETAGDGDDRFEAGEIRERTHDADTVLSVTVVHEPTNTVLARETRDVPPAGSVAAD